jgi:putative transposase
LIIQVCDAEDVVILKGVVSKDPIHMHIEYPVSLVVSEFVKRVKGSTSRLLQQEFPKLAEQYWGRHFWAIGYGAWSTGNITKDIIQAYLEHHRHPSQKTVKLFIIEE